jgi:hypothetical protein
MLVPERVEPRDRCRLEIRHCQDVAEIVGTERRTIGDQAVDMDSIPLPAQKLLQVEVDLRLEDTDHRSAGLDPAAHIGQEIVGVAEGKGDALALKIRSLATPIARRV